ncbi:uncharacterized protein L969DRAFT_19984 [Mixia osmundae IAM 14324]|uniref:uncharacterized protein n=1 Tax=Mixia osmundae (strain CBS 9802 / IAM 14324 / JCM 22182 / KY 12970) TaxID=764103 RepID=UPI0004A556F0|nr:uncharacterized protein L969DRAFT_19984 [Mixia osmundae IAM 14324]KEI36592.1 hypothetical protein L969DRAFT_19984 [Mixia osmundae IAM 14324]
MTRDANTREAGPQTQPQAQSNAYAINAFGNWLRQNAPAALAAGNVLLAPMQTRQVSDHTANLSASGSLVADPQPQPAHATRESLRQRRAKLEKELADLRTQSDDDEPIQHLRTAADSYEQIDKNEIPTHPVPITPTRQTSGWWSWSGSAPRQKAE